MPNKAYLVCDRCLTKMEIVRQSSKGPFFVPDMNITGFFDRVNEFFMTHKHERLDGVRLEYEITKEDDA